LPPNEEGGIVERAPGDLGRGHLGLCATTGGGVSAGSRGQRDRVQRLDLRLNGARWASRDSSRNRAVRVPGHCRPSRTRSGNSAEARPPVPSRQAKKWPAGAIIGPWRDGQLAERRGGTARSQVANLPSPKNRLESMASRSRAPCSTRDILRILWLWGLWLARGSRFPSTVPRTLGPVQQTRACQYRPTCEG